MTFSSYPGTYVLSGSTDRAIHLSRALPSTDTRSVVETTRPIQKYEAHGYSILDIAVSSDNSRFASVGGDRQVFLWDVEQGGTVRRWTGHSSRVEAVQFAGEGDSVVVSGMVFLQTISGLRMETDLISRQRGYHHQPMGHQVQFVQANSELNRSFRYRLLATRPHAHLLNC